MQKTALLTVALALVGGLLWAERTAVPPKSDDDAVAIHQLRAQVGDLTREVAALKAQIAVHSANNEIFVRFAHQHAKALDTLAGHHVACISIKMQEGGKVQSESCAYN